MEPPQEARLPVLDQPEEAKLTGAISAAVPIREGPERLRAVAPSVSNGRSALDGDPLASQRVAPADGPAAERDPGREVLGKRWKNTISDPKGLRRN